MRTGDLVRLAAGAKVYDSNPIVYGFHKTLWIDPGSLGVVTHVQESYVRLVCEAGVTCWIESRHLEVINEAG